MNNTRDEAEIQANVERAEESLLVARDLWVQKHYDVVASRAYYTVFYAATALLLSEGLEFSRHSGVIAAIHRHFVKTGRLDKRLGKNLNWLFSLRSIGDYGVTRHVSAQDAENAIKASDEFLTIAKSMITIL